MEGLTLWLTFLVYGAEHRDCCVVLQEQNEEEITLATIQLRNKFLSPIYVFLICDFSLTKEHEGYFLGGGPWGTHQITFVCVFTLDSE